MTSISVRTTNALLLLAIVLAPCALKAQTTYTWNGSTSSAWNLAANWTPSTGFPLAADNAVIVSAGIPPVLDVSRSVTNLTVNTGTLNLGGATLTVTGNANFNGGTLTNGSFAANSPAGSVRFMGTNFQVPITGSTSALEFDGGTFNAAVNLTKTGPSNDYSNGATTFNSTLTLTVTDGRLYIGHTGSTVFQDNVVLNSTGNSGGYWFGQSTGSLTLAAGRTVSAGTFNTGSLLFRNFTQTGGTAQNISLTGTSMLYFQTGTTFNGDLVCTSGGLYMNGATFQGTVRASKTGLTNEYSGGGNTFQGTTEFINTGAGSLFLANTGADQYNGNLVLNATGGGGILFGNGGGTSTLLPGRTLSIGSTGFTNGRLQLRNFTMAGTTPMVLVMGTNATYVQAPGSQFGGDVNVTAGSILLHGGTVNGNATFVKVGDLDDWGNGGCTFQGDLDLTNTGAGHFGPCNTGSDIYNGNIRVSTTSTGSIRFGQSSGTATLAAGRTIAVGAGGYTGAQFLLQRFTQLGNTPQVITLSANTRVYLRTGCSFGGDLTITGASYEISNSTFARTCTLNMIGSLSDACPGGNVFNGTLTINKSSTGDLFLSDNANDTYNGDVVLNNTVGGDIRFGNGGGTPVLSPGRTLTMGTFSTGMLVLRNFRQQGSTAQVFNMGSTARLYIMENTVFQAPLSISVGQFHSRGAEYQADFLLTKTGITADASPGGNVFRGAMEVVNMTTGSIYFAENDTDHYEGNIRFSNLANGDIRIGSSGSGGGVLANGATMAVGSGGFDNGLLLLRDLHQVGNTPQTLSLGSGARLLIFEGCEFEGALTVTSGTISFRESVFHQATTFTKTGPNGDASAGGNVFNGTLEVINTSAAIIYLGESFGDQYNEDVVLSNTGGGQLRFGNSGAATSTLAAGKTIRIGAGGFAAGVLLLRRFVQLGSEPMSLLLGDAARLYFFPGTEIGGPIQSSSGEVYFFGTTFHRDGRFVKNGPNGDASDGGCVFHGRAEFVNTNTGNLSLNTVSPDIFNGDIVLNNTSTGGMFFGNSTGSATLAAGRTISVGSLGYNSGFLHLRSFTQLGPMPQNILLGPAATLLFNPGNTFNGDLVTTSGRLFFMGSTFNGTCRFTKTGPAGDSSQGGNVFNGRTEFENTGTGNLSLARTGGTDQYNADVILNNTSTGQIEFGAVTGSAVLAAGRTISIGALGFDAGFLVLRNFTQLGTTPQVLSLGNSASLEFGNGSVFNGNVTSTAGRLFFQGTTFHGVSDHTKTNNNGDGSVGNNTFHGDVTFRQTSNGHLSLDQAAPDLFNGNIILINPGGGQFSFGANTGTATLAAGRTIAVAPGTFDAGILNIKNFTQVGSTPQALLLGTNANLTFQTGSTFNGNIQTTSGRLFLNGTTFNGTARFNKTGGGGDGSIGGNTFNQQVEFTVSSTGNLSLHHSVDDTFNGDIRVNSTSTGQISFGQVSATSTLAAGRTIAVGSGGFAAGTLLLRQFTQVGPTAQSLLLGTNANLYLQSGVTFNGNITAVAGNLFLNGSTYNGTAFFRKTGTTGNSCTGNNVFAGNTELVNSGVGNWFMANTGNDVYSGDLLLNSTGAGGISFGNGGGTSFVSTGTLGIGSSGFTAGTITFRGFTKQSASATTLSGGVNTGLVFQSPTVFFGALTTTSGNLALNGGTFQGNVVMSKTGTAGNNSAGGNTFNGDAVINASGAMTLAVSAADDFNGNVTFRRLGAGTLVVNNTFNTTFSRNVSTVGSTGSVQFGAGTGRTVFDGTTVQTFNSDAAFPPQVRNLTLAMTGAGELQLLGNVNVTVDIAFASGVVKPTASTSTSNGLLILANGVTISDPADAASHVDGFVRKIGNTAFTFPVGSAGRLAPISISAPAVNTHHFTARYVATTTHPTYSHLSKDPTIDHLSQCEYWILDRTNSTTNVSVTLTWDTPRSCGVTDLSQLAVARWNGSQWKDHGGSAVGSLTTGSITTAAPVSSFASPSLFTLASTGLGNPLPIQLIAFTAVNDGSTVRTDWSTAVEIDNDRFEVERSHDAISFDIIGTVDGVGTSQTTNHYMFVDEEPLSGISYYRLKQVDTDGTFTHGPVVAVVRDDTGAELNIWPNPTEQEVHFSANADMEHIRLYDASGRTVHEQRVNGITGVITMDLAGLPSGVHFLAVEMTDGSIRQQRIMKR